MNDLKGIVDALHVNFNTNTKQWENFAKSFNYFSQYYKDKELEKEYEKLREEAKTFG